MPRKSLKPSAGDVTKQSFQCIACKSNFTKQRNNFPASQSSLYAGNNFYLPWCWRCIDGFYRRYRDECGLSEEETIKRLCSKFDIYWQKELYLKMPSAVSTTQSRMRTYIGKTYLTQYAGKTYDNTIAEEAAAALLSVSKQEPEETQEQKREVPRKLIDFWGRDFDPDDYFDLQASYERLTAGKAIDDPATQMLVKQACLSEIEIAALKREGKPYEKQQASLINTLGSLNLKPSQIKEAEKNSGLDNLPLGLGIMRWEQTRPIPDPDPDWQDVDNIRGNMLTWYTGASLKMIGVKDAPYAELFDEAIGKYTVQRPDELDGESAVMHYLVESGDKSAEGN